MSDLIYNRVTTGYTPGGLYPAAHLCGAAKKKVPLSWHTFQGHVQWALHAIDGILTSARLRMVLRFGRIKTSLKSNLTLWSKWGIFRPQNSKTLAETEKNQNGAQIEKSHVSNVTKYTDFDDWFIIKANFPAKNCHRCKFFHKRIRRLQKCRGLQFCNVALETKYGFWQDIFQFSDWLF